MSVPLLLQNLDFTSVNPYKMSKLFSELYDKSIFEPLITIPVLDYPYLLRELFGPISNLDEVISLANQDFFEYMRIEVLYLLGYFSV
jgi:hypothetical protein